MNLINMGWVRIRRYPNKGWSITIDSLTPGKKDIICQWANLVLSGINGFKEIDPYMPVNIVAVDDGALINHTVNEIANRWGKRGDLSSSHIIVLDSFNQLPDI